MDDIQTDKQTSDFHKLNGVFAQLSRIIHHKFPGVHAKLV